MKKLNENTKVTLTLGQLKRLVKENTADSDKGIIYDLGEFLEHELNEAVAHDEETSGEEPGSFGVVDHSDECDEPDTYDEMGLDPSKVKIWQFVEVWIEDSDYYDYYLDLIANAAARFVKQPIEDAISPDYKVSGNNRHTIMVAFTDTDVGEQVKEEEGDGVKASVDKQALWDKIYQVLKQEALDFSSNYTQPLELWDIDVITREDRDEYQAGDTSEYGYAVKWGYDAAVDLALEDHEWTYVMVYEEPESEEELKNQFTFDDVVNNITQSHLRDRYEEIQCGSFEHGHFKYIVFVEKESKAKSTLNENTKVTLTLKQLKRLVKESGMHHAERDLLTYAFNNGFKCSYEPLKRTMTIRGKRGTFAQRGNGEDLLMVLCQGASVNPNDLDYEAGDSYMLKLKVDVKTHYWLEGYGEAPAGVYESYDSDERVIKRVLKDPDVRECATKLIDAWIEDMVYYPGSLDKSLREYVSWGDERRWKELQHAIAAASNRYTKSVQTPKPPLRQPEEFSKPNKRK